MTPLKGRGDYTHFVGLKQAKTTPLVCFSSKKQVSKESGLALRVIPYLLINY
jgi:hypothetical protein